MYNAKNIYLLKHSTKRIYYILRKEIQIVPVHILDNRVDEIEYWQLDIASHLIKQRNCYLTI